MPELRRSPNDEPSLEAIRRSDDFLDALAAGRPVGPQDSADAALASLLGTWRDETRWPPATGLITEPQALAALAAGRSEKRPGPKREQPRIAPQRNRRGLSVVGAAAAAVLCVGGFGAVVAGAGPGDALYGLRSMLFGAPKEVRDDQVALAARTEMQQVQEMISRGDWQQAQEKLVAVSTQVAEIGDGQQKQELLDQFNDLSAKVVERDPQATAPPGITYTVPPSATELVPAVVPPTTTDTSDSEASTSQTPTSGTSTSQTPTSGTSTSGTSTSGTSTSGTGAESSSAPGSTASSQPTSPATSGPSSSPSTTSSPAQQSRTSTATSAPASTVSSAQATTSVPVTSTAGKSAAATTTATPPATTTAAAPAATTTAAAPAATTTAAAPAATTTAAASAATSSTAARAPAATEAETAQQVVTTTTAVLPAPVG